MNHSPQIVLAAARRELDAHRQECTAWDYESDGDCRDCEWLSKNVSEAKQNAHKETP